MALYERLMGIETPKLSPHHLMAVLAEVQRGTMTGAQASAFLGLDTDERSEATTLFGTFTGNVAQKLARALEVHDVLLLAEGRRAPYDTAAAVRTRLGV